MKCTIHMTDFDKITSSWNQLWRLKRQCIFVLPALLKVWWREFGAGSELYLCEVRKHASVIGIAPLLLRDGRVFFIGSSDVCDYQDFVVAPGSESDFFNILISYLMQRDISCLDLRLVRPDSMVMNLVGLAPSGGFEVFCNQKDVLLEMNLPGAWEEYLARLTSRHRHDLRRKLRRFWEAGNVNYRVIEDTEGVSQAMDVFLKLFRESKKDKAAFMNAKMERFFRSLMEVMAEAKLLKLGVLELDSSPVAMVICFDDGDTVYLYNNGYDPRYSRLSPGFVSKVLAIRYSIQRGRRMFNFLKGAETYKYHLGGRETSLYSCKIALIDRQYSDNLGE